jgi:hypothetical protein
VALPKIGINEGSLLRRTLLHVGTFVLGSVAFIGFVSFVLVSLARGLVAPKDAATDEEPEVAATAGPKLVRPPGVKLPAAARNKRGAPAPGVPAAAAPAPVND